MAGMDTAATGRKSCPVSFGHKSGLRPSKHETMLENEVKCDETGPRISLSYQQKSLNRCARHRKMIQADLGDFHDTGIQQSSS